MLSVEEKEAINSFFEAVDKLKSLNIVRSNRFLGDLGEFFATKAISIQLNTNKRQKGFDAILDNKKYEIKYANGTKTNISLGNPNEYDFVILVIGRDSVIFNSSINANYAIYKLTNTDALKYSTEKGVYSFGKNVLKSLTPIMII